MWLCPFIIPDRGKLGINSNNREYLSKKTSYIENLDYVILTEFNIIENEFWDQFLYVQFCQKYPLFREYILDMYKSLI